MRDRNRQHNNTGTKNCKYIETIYPKTGALGALALGKFQISCVGHVSLYKCAFLPDLLSTSLGEGTNGSLNPTASHAGCQTKQTLKYVMWRLTSVPQGKRGIKQQVIKSCVEGKCPQMDI